MKDFKLKVLEDNMVKLSTIGLGVNYLYVNPKARRAHNRQMGSYQI